jgi:hypothetical protein
MQNEPASPIPETITTAAAGKDGAEAASAPLAVYAVPHARPRIPPPR